LDETITLRDRLKSISTSASGGEKMPLPYLKAILMALTLAVLGSGLVPAVWSRPPEVPVKGMVTLVDLGAGACIPCKMMAPILEKLEKVYQGRAAIVFIDVWKNPDEVKRFNLQAIPTQIFYDKKGKEVFRHMGFMGEKDIVAVLDKLGVN
jgi:thioredoxin 1